MGDKHFEAAIQLRAALYKTYGNLLFSIAAEKDA